MSKKLRLEIFREPYTSRDRILDNRHNIILNFEARVPDNSYLLIGGAEIEYIGAREIRDIATRIAEEIIKGKSIDTYLIDNLVKKYKFKGKKLVQINSNICIDNTLIIPSSSLKGAIRSRLEYKFLIKDGKTYSCYSVQGIGAVNMTYAKRHIKFWGSDVINNRAICNASLSDKVCKVCDLFGAPGLGSRVEFSNAIPTTKVSLVDVFIYRSKYSVIPPGTNFKFKAYCKNFSLEDLGFLLAAMEIYTKSPIIIGRFKYKFNPIVGEKFNEYYFGLLKIDIKEVEYVYPKWEYKGINDVIEASKRRIEHYVREGYFDINRGVIT